MGCPVPSISCSKSCRTRVPRGAPRLRNTRLFPDELVEHLQTMPLLERLSVSFDHRNDLPPNLRPAGPPIILPALSFSFDGWFSSIDVLLARIETPNLRSFKYTIKHEWHRSEFLTRFSSGWRDLRPTTASILIDSTDVTLDAHVGLPSSPDYRSIQIVALGPLEGGTIMAWYFSELCDEVAPALSAVQRLSIREDVPDVDDPEFAKYPDGDHNWEALLSTFSGITRLDVGTDTFPIAQIGMALPDLGAEPDLVPHLRVIGYHLGDPDDLEALYTHEIPPVLSGFISARAATGRPVEVEYMPWQRGDPAGEVMNNSNPRL
ncbi:hypothetical protein BC834DRAFT_166829 [Gloeopeniophorella convolvens]|nr:hypothetical protein BC834DRAFT_166829 [Gloeopeniophorella convolvens]